MLPKEVTKKITGLHHFIIYICDSNNFLYLFIDQMLVLCRLQLSYANSFPESRSNLDNIRCPVLSL